MSKDYQDKDPHYQREADRYEHPVPSREYISKHLKQLGKPASFSKLCKAFGLDTEVLSIGLERRLKAMIRDGQLHLNRRGAYALVEGLELIPGRILAHRDGYGFLIPDNGSNDIFLPARQMSKVFTDDRALVRVTNGNARRQEGIIIEVLERNTTQVVGRYLEEGQVGFIDPENKNMPLSVIIAAGDRKNVKPGEFAVAQIITQPSARRMPTGKITEVLGDHLTPGMEVELMIRSHNLPFKWTDKILKAIETLPDKVQPKQWQGRTDLRELNFVTIDGEDAKDFDDAVFCEPIQKGGWHLYVAIADVAHYVKQGTDLDKEAELRGNSVYFPNRVVPMLPEKLSNGLCSLRPEVERLAIVCKMNIDATGNIKKYEFFESVIRSKARLTYTEVAELLASGQFKYQALTADLKNLHALYKVLFQQRQIRGAIEFETTETMIEFDKLGKIGSIVPVQRNVAHRIIEECMLAANISAADFLTKHKIQALYRVHETPSLEKLTALRDFLKTFGLRLMGGVNPSSMDYANLLKRVMERPNFHLIQTVMLRSLPQAHYSPDNKGHFGLAYEQYTHFTSPIRRYPDLIVHRAIKSVLKSEDIKVYSYDNASMHHLGEHCGATERRADWATRDATDWLKCEYMLKHVGKEYSGVIVDVTSFGVFVELEAVYVQGLVHVTSLRSDYYHYDATHHSLKGRRGGKVYQLGDKVNVVISRVDLDARKIDFELAGEFSKEACKKSKKRKRSKNKSNQKSKKKTKK
ncbi:MAG: ribonuclease R [Gammaproteobacteria bacterium]|nr:ribonuclease R [Gammaproteobacteria bacterium]